MDRMLYLAMNGASQTLKSQTVNAQNLANANVSGFRADLATFSESPIPGPGLASRVNAVASGQGVNFQSGAILTTGRDLDIAINGEGWLAVQDPNGNEAYTRAGNLHISANGLLLTGSGQPVLGNGGGPITMPPAEKIAIGGDGTISIRPVGQDANGLVTVDRIKMVQPDHEELTKGADGLMHLRNNGVADADAAVSLTSGSLEGSNVNAVDALVDMISLSRQFEMQIKMMQVAKDNDQASAQLLGQQ